MATSCDNIVPADILFILENPWEISKNEWHLYDHNQIQSNLLHIQSELKLAEDGGYSRIWKTEDNEPIAILGCLKKEDQQFQTFFVASKHMEKHALKISFEMRDLLREQSTIFKGHTCYLRSYSNHSHQIKWFKFLGFAYIPEKNTGLQKYFEYVSPNS
jgi:hypothetical protein